MPLDGSSLGAPVYSLPENAGWKNYRYLVIVKTSTSEKIIQYQTVARVLGLPILFRGLNEVVGPFHSVDEDTGDRQKNAAKKDNATKKKVALLYSNKTYNELLRRKCADWGVPYNENNIFFASDDTTFEFPTRIWGDAKGGLRQLLKRFVPDDLLASASAVGDQMAGPGAETGPIIAATGATLFFQLVKEAKDAAREICMRSAQYMDIKQSKTLLFVSMVDAKNGVESKEIDIAIISSVHLPENIAELELTPRNRFNTTDQFYTDPRTDKPVADDLLGYLTRSSPHVGVVKAFYEYVTSRSVLEDFATVGKPIRPEDKDGFKIFRPQFIEESNVKASDIYEVLNIGHKFAGADMLEFYPFNHRDPVARRKNYYELISAVVDEQLTPKGRRIVVRDDGSWTPFLEMLYEMANQGMSKDFDLSAYEGGPLAVGKHTRHFATGFLDVIQGKDSFEIGVIAKKVADIRRKSYSRSAVPDAKSSSIELDAANLQPIQTPTHKQFSVGIMSSANSDNRRLTKNLSAYGKKLAEIDARLVWGAGDRHAMWAAPQSYVKWTRTLDKIKQLIGYTTSPIAESETIHGKPPVACDNKDVLCEDIYRRMSNMFEQSDVVVVAPGGYGTLQELLAYMRLCDEAPELMRNKSLVIYSPDIHGDHFHANPFWEKIMSTICDGDSDEGNGLWSAVQKNKRAGVRNIHLAQDNEQLGAITDDLKLKHDQFYGLIRRAATSARARRAALAA
jgi:predicted Rossmann-fold nucleotide-binding protein